ncbi:hypothetical protein H0A66_06005 [Alcaligenaceae bacterium]|nr:hypothetical protein [Alcaligenaceae bacterium]
MSLQTPYLFPHPESDMLWFRRRVPGHLHSVVGRSEIKISLQTAVVKQAVQRCRMTANVVDKLFDEAQTRHDATHSATVSAQLKMLQNEFCDPDAFTNPLERCIAGKRHPSFQKQPVPTDAD